MVWSHTQDYNREVLKALTIPTVTANVHRLAASQHRPATRFLAGSWALLPAWLEGAGLGHSFDMVLTAETIYDTESSVQLYHCLLQVSSCKRKVANEIVHSFQCCIYLYTGLEAGRHRACGGKDVLFWLGRGFPRLQAAHGATATH